MNNCLNLTIVFIMPTLSIYLYIYIYILFYILSIYLCIHIYIYIYLTIYLSHYCLHYEENICIYIYIHIFIYISNYLHIHILHLSIFLSRLAFIHENIRFENKNLDELEDLIEWNENNIKQSQSQPFTFTLHQKSSLFGVCARVCVCARILPVPRLWWQQIRKS